MDYAIIATAALCGGFAGRAGAMMLRASQRSIWCAVSEDPAIGLLRVHYSARTPAAARRYASRHGNQFVPLSVLPINVVDERNAEMLHTSEFWGVIRDVMRKAEHSGDTALLEQAMREVLRRQDLTLDRLDGMTQEIPVVADPPAEAPAPTPLDPQYRIDLGPDDQTSVMEAFAPTEALTLPQVDPAPAVAPVKAGAANRRYVAVPTGEVGLYKVEPRTE